jgi:hypothetical protein
VEFEAFFFPFPVDNQRVLFNRCCEQSTPQNIHLKYHLLVITISDMCGEEKLNIEARHIQRANDYD